jgi:hypothetical protein
MLELQEEWHISSRCNQKIFESRDRILQQQSKSWAKLSPLSFAKHNRNTTPTPQQRSNTRPVQANHFALPSLDHKSHLKVTLMERRLSIGSASVESQQQRRRLEVHRVGMADEARGSVINYLSNPCFHPHHAFKMAGTIEEMEQRRQLLTDHAIVISDEGPLGVSPWRR